MLLFFQIFDNTLSCTRKHEVDIDPTLFYNNSNYDWRKKFKPYKGMCYTYRAPDHLHKATISKIKMNFKQPVDVYLHHPGQFCTWNVIVLLVQKRQIYADVSYQVLIKFLYLPNYLV